MKTTSEVLNQLNTELTKLQKLNNFNQVKRVILSVIDLFEKKIDLDDADLFRLFTDQKGKIRSNSAWFFEDETILDRKATYTVNDENNLNIDFKVFGLSNPSKRVISWVQALTPNYEDEPFYSQLNLGIDFIIPKTFDRVTIVLSRNYVIRTIELNGNLTSTYNQIFNKWGSIKDFARKGEVHEIIWNSFDIKPINKQFYAQVFENYVLLKQHLSANKILDEKHAGFFTSRLLGRIIFCWFLNKKNIIDNNFKYFDSKNYKNANLYYRDKLESLFFEVLNTPITDRSNSDNKTPFLNGGLFEIHKDDLFKDTKLTFPNNYFDNLYQFLKSYNFTTDESSSQFQQVAIDPEMLGRIFENLLAEISDNGEQIRKTKGAFYTPREIVDFICEKSIVEYLRNKLPNDEYRDKRLSQLVEGSDREFQDQESNWRRDWKPYKENILKALDDLKIIDPACGSGAFPMGMLQKLVRIYERLEPRFDPYKSKLRILEQNIFGVDIEPMAIEISRLRAWLSLIVDENKKIGDIQPLPNLDFKFICANSLVSLEKDINFFIGEDINIGDKLQDIRSIYFNTNNLENKLKLRNEYEKILSEQQSTFGDSHRSEQLKSYMPFDSETISNFLDPQEMFGFQYFDIVIGNPPYVGEKGHKELFQVIKGTELEKYSYSKMDYFYYFIHLGLNLLKQQGILTYITTNYFLTATGGIKLRKDLYERSTVKLLVNFNEYKIFDSALGQHNIISMFEKGKKQDAISKFIWVDNLEIGLELEEILYVKSNKVNSFEIPQLKIFENSESKYIRFPSTDSYSNYDFTNILEKISNNKSMLGQLFSINQGAVTGAHKFNKKHLALYPQINSMIGSGIFILGENDSTEGMGKNNLKPFYKNSDIKKWFVNTDTNQKLLYIHEKIVPNKYELNHLKKYKPILDERREVINGVRQWYELTWPRDPELFEKVKIVWPYRSHENRFALSSSTWFGSTDLYLLTKSEYELDLKYVLAILNSSIYYIWLYFKGKRKGNMLELFQVPISEIPIPVPDKSKINEIISIVDKILLLSTDNDSTKIEEFEINLDIKISKLLGISQKELEEVWNFKNAVLHDHGINEETDEVLESELE